MNKLELARIMLKHPPEKILEMLEDLNKIVVAYMSHDSTISTDIDDPQQPEDEIIIEPDTEIKHKVFEGYIFGNSDVREHFGKSYIIPAANLKNSIKSITVGSSVFKRERDYKNSELWYGVPENDYITVVFKDGSIAKSPTKITSPLSEPSYQEIPRGDRIQLRYHRRTNTNRPTYYTFTNDKLKVGDKVHIEMGPISRTVIAVKRRNGSIGYPYESGGDGQLLVKNSDVPERGVCLLTPSTMREDLNGYIEIV